MRLVAADIRDGQLVGNAYDPDNLRTCYELCFRVPCIALTSFVFLRSARLVRTLWSVNQTDHAASEGRPKSGVRDVVVQGVWVKRLVSYRIFIECLLPYVPRKAAFSFVESGWIRDTEGGVKRDEVQSACAQLQLIEVGALYLVPDHRSPRRSLDAFGRYYVYLFASPARLHLARSLKPAQTSALTSDRVIRPIVAITPSHSIFFTDVKPYSKCSLDGSRRGGNIWLALGIIYWLPFTLLSPRHHSRTYHLRNTRRTVPVVRRPSSTSRSNVQARFTRLMVR
ncbi:hypothetical protein BC629DRAFT_975154 [Irpex lacteus]|nr:hypothetical protein BC629DRAFT_975154 [Irpex lacteus]